MKTRTDAPSHPSWALLLSTCALVAAVLNPNVCHSRALQEWGAPHPDSRPLSKTAIAFPVFETRLHYAGDIWLAITNHGLLGTEDQNRVHPEDRRALRINYSPSFEFPAGSNNGYLYVGGMWVGGIVGTDTLVSMPVNGTSSTWAGEFASYDTIRESSSLRASPYYHPDAKAEQEYYALYSDTLITNGTDELEGRPHRPLNIEVSQTSYSWSDKFSRQFVIIECWIRNIGTRPIAKLAAGFFIDADVLNERGGSAQAGYIDDISGFLRIAPSLNNPVEYDPLYVAWVADNDGDPVGGSFPQFAPRGAVGIRILRSFRSERFSFNWWTNEGNWGPVRGTSRTPQTQGGLGSPQGDRNAYFLMTNGEIDYGQLLSALDQTADGWRSPRRYGGCDLADGTDTREVISVGPACDLLYPGDSMPFVYAVCAGDRVHREDAPPFDCRAPGNYVDAMDFSDLAYAATWASWVYDTPGYDTDGDKYEGEYRNSAAGRIYLTGDLGPTPGWNHNCVDYGGAPDFAGPSGPPCPVPGENMFVETIPGEIIVRWSGRLSESTPDPLTKEIDFEGYRLYVGKIDSPDQYSLISSWDRTNYRRHVLRGSRWDAEDSILTREQLQDYYGEDFDPDLYDVPSTGTCFRDTIDFRGFRVERCSYFAPLGVNRGNLFMENDIEQINIIQHMGDSTVVENGETQTFGYYEAHIRNMNASDNVYVTVTAFDYGAPSLQLDALESNPGTCAEFAIPIYSSSVVEDSGLHVSVYPNPYRASYIGRDGRRTTYFDQGYEASDKRGSYEGMSEEDRRIWFINLPSKATIRIYTLDGDLLRTIKHEWPKPEGIEGVLTDYSSRAAWDLVSRNTQAVVSGIYIYHVESALGSQTGTIVIIK